jgi:hypothetical protein
LFPPLAVAGPSKRVSRGPGDFTRSTETHVGTAGSLTFKLDHVTVGDSQLILTGLDDELTGSNPMFVTVSGQVIFGAGSPFFD